MKSFLAFWAIAMGSGVSAGETPAVHLWFEPEWFEGVAGSFAYWTGQPKATGSWGIAGPGIAAEWSQGGESEWNSMGAAADESKARCQRAFSVPRAGDYHVWVRYVDHRKKTEPFRVVVQQGGKDVVSAELGVEPVLPANDEYQLYWGFAFAWGKVPAKLGAGPAKLVLAIDRPGEAWRQLDAVLVTSDLGFVPHGREKPRFAFEDAIKLQPAEGQKFRGTGMGIRPDWKRPQLGGGDFSMWTGIGTNPKWWEKQTPEKLSLQDVYFEFSPPSDIKAQFHKQFAGQKNIPIMSWTNLLPGFYLGETPDLTPGGPLFRWLTSTKAPFYIMTNYASGNYNDKNGPATYQALTGPLKDQFLGFIHGEAMGTGGVSPGDKVLGGTRRAHVDAMGKVLLKQQAEAWSKIFKTPVPESFWSKGISCLSAESTAVAHLFHEMGARTVGYEEDATNVHVPMRIAFERGAARQYGGNWINYASGNFGDSCNYFTQEPIVPRGAKGWYHSRYAVTDGVSIAWYRKLYYLNYLSGADAIYWEQNLTNQFMLPGPGSHPIQLSPFGRATEDFQGFVSNLKERGEPITPVGILLSYGHGYDRVNYRCKMLNVFQEDVNDLELRELFNVCWHPAVALEGLPASPDVQSMPSGVYGNIFDVLVDRPARAKAILEYPVIWAAGDADVANLGPGVIEEYLKRGGTLVLNTTAAAKMPAKLVGLQLAGNVLRAEEWAPAEQPGRGAVPFNVAAVKLEGAKALAAAKVKGQDVPLITRHEVGSGAVIVHLVPNLMGLDERAHPSVAYLMNGLTAGLLPIDVRLSSGDRPSGEIMYQVNKTKDGYLVALLNQRGIDKTQNGIARVDRRAFVDIVLRCPQGLKAAREHTELRDLPVTNGEIRLRVPAGDVRVVKVVLK